jgi:predicted amidophosphoribosyltransferase
MLQRDSEISLQRQNNGAKRGNAKVTPEVAVENRQPDREPDKIFCPQCGAVMTWWRGSPFCPKCGFRGGCCD